MTRPPNSQQGLAVLLVAVVIAAAVGAFVFSAIQKDDLVRKEIGVSQLSERNQAVAQNLATALRALIDFERIAVKPGPKFALKKGPLPRGWAIISGRIDVAACDLALFKPENAALSFKDGAKGVDSECGGEKRAFRIEAKGALPPNVLRIEISAAPPKHTAEVSWTTNARILVSGCLLGLPRKTVALHANFPAFVAGCPFGIGDNLPASSSFNGIMTARSEVRIPLTKFIPANATVCSLSLESLPSAAKYDDAIFLHFSGAMLMGSNQYLYPLFETNADGIQEYDWKRIVGKPYVSNSTVALCAGGLGTKCVVPPTEKTGAFLLDFDESTIRRIADWVHAKGEEYALTLLVTGDEDPGDDCKALPISLTGKASFIE